MIREGNWIKVGKKPPPNPVVVLSAELSATWSAWVRFHALPLYNLGQQMFNSLFELLVISHLRKMK